MMLLEIKCWILASMRTPIAFKKEEASVYIHVCVFMLSELLCVVGGKLGCLVLKTIG